MRRLWMVSVGMGVLSASGCRSAFIDAALVNGTSTPISVLEVDYPSASFGTQMLAPGATFRYRFKVLGSGPTKLTYTDNTQHEHTSMGPALSEGAEGTLIVTIVQAKVEWQPHLTQAK